MTFESVSEWSKQIVTIASATLVLTATFIKMPSRVCIPPLMIAPVSLTLSANVPVVYLHKERITFHNGESPVPVGFCEHIFRTPKRWREQRWK
jgi:hypothetical protein